MRTTYGTSESQTQKKFQLGMILPRNTLHKGNSDVNSYHMKLVLNQTLALL